MSNSLSRKIDHRKSLLRNLTTSLVLYEEIRTTKAKAREVRSIVERLISRTKKEKNSLVMRREFLGYFYDENAVKKMFEVIIPRFNKINSGFTRIIKVGHRLGDSAEIVILKFQEGEKVEPARIAAQSVAGGEKIENKGVKNASVKKDNRKETITKIKK